MSIRLEISSKVPDTRAGVRKNRMMSLDIQGAIDSISLVDVYTIDKSLSQKNLETVFSLLSNSVTQSASFSKPIAPEHFQYAIEVGFLPGVTDNVANTAQEQIEDALQTNMAAGADRSKKNGHTRDAVIYKLYLYDYLSC